MVGGRYHADARFDELYTGLRYEPIEGGVPLSESDLEGIRGTYDDAVRYADAWFGELMAGLEAQGRLDDTILVVLGDHGEDLGEHGFFNHRPALCPHVTDVPLMIRFPGREPARVTETTSLVAVAPLLYEEAGLAPPAGLHEPGGTAFAESAFREVLAVRGGQRLSFTGLSPSNPLLVPLMQASTLGWRGDEELREELVAWREAVEPRQGGELTEARRRLLQERGYWAP